MKKMRNILAILIVLSLALTLFAGCTGNADTTPSGTTDSGNEATDPTDNGGEENTDPTDPTIDYVNPDELTWDEKDEDLLGITDSVIYVGNTAATTGTSAPIGEPFNVGIMAALAAYNAKGGFNGKTVELKTYDDGGDATKSVTLMEQLVYDDEVFAVVGNFGSYAVAANLDILIEEGVPMVYAAAGNDVLYNGSAEGGEKAIFPVQPLNHTEGQIMILRAFAPTENGGLGGTKVGVLSNNDEASQSMLAGIKEEAETSGLTANITYQNVSGDDFSAAINAFKNAGCDVVVIAVTGSNFTNALLAMANANYYASVLTTYNNASASVLNDDSTTVLKSEYEAVLANIPIYAQAWLDITSSEYVYDVDAATGLGQAYQALYALYGMGYSGVGGFTEEYWEVASNIYDYCVAAGRTDALAMSYNSYALAGYIAGDLFCQGLAALEEGGYALTRNNYIQIMETQAYKISMADYLSFANGMRSGVQSFALTAFYDLYDTNGGLYHSASSYTAYGLVSIEEYRALLAG